MWKQGFDSLREGVREFSQSALDEMKQASRQISLATGLKRFCEAFLKLPTPRREALSSERQPLTLIWQTWSLGDILRQYYINDLPSLGF